VAVVDGSIRGGKNVAILNNSQDQDLSLGISSKDFITDPWLSVRLELMNCTWALTMADISR
jgi:hypothetical protein